jgi:hypothetical protein
MTLAEVELIDGDLAIGAERIDRAPDDSYRQAVSIVQERHQAFNWLLGLDPLYSEITTDT